MNKVSKHNAEHYKWGNDSDGWRLLNKKETSLIQEKMLPGTSEKKHFHVISRQFFFVLEGNASIETEEEIINLQKHEGIEIPPGTRHRFFNSSLKPVEFLVISVPSTLNDRTDVD
jgi:mannose-6-phosphate isomerase-like protein (cupin superfamily)